MAPRGCIRVGPAPTTFRVKRVLPASRPGFVPVVGNQIGRKNEEFLLFKNVRCLLDEPVHFDVYIDNPHAVVSSGKDRLADGFVGGWVWSPGLGGGIDTHRISIVQNLKQRGKMEARKVKVTIVTYRFEGNGTTKMFPKPVAFIEKVSLEYE